MFTLELETRSCLTKTSEMSIKAGGDVNVAQLDEDDLKHQEL